MATQKMTKNQMRRAKKKEQKKTKSDPVSTEPSKTEEAQKADESVNEVETSASAPEVRKDGSEAAPADGPVPDPLDEFDDDPAFSQYRDIFQKFGATSIIDGADVRGSAKDKEEVYFGTDEI